MRSIALKCINGLFKSSQKTTKETLNQVVSLPQTKVRASLPGRTTMERIFGDKLVVTETQILENGLKKTSTAVYSSKGAHIGYGDSGLETFRETTVARKKGESIFGGDIVEINKNYHDTMAETGRSVKTVKNYTPEGVAEHVEQSVKYRHWEQAEVTVTDKTKSAFTGETKYTEAIKKKKAAEEAQEIEKQALLKAQKEAEEEAKKILPRINTGKMFNKNIEDFTKMNEVVKPDGTIIRSYKAKGANGNNQYIVTKDKGSYHEEYLVDTAKNIKIRCYANGDKIDKITMKNGLNYSANLKRSKEGYLYGTYKYHDGVNYAVWNNSLPGAREFRCPELTKEINILEEQLHNGKIPFDDYWNAMQKITDKRSILAKEIENVHKDKFIYLEDLYKPYKP